MNELSNFILFITGRSVSVLVSSVYTFVIGLYVLQLTGSGLSFAITLSLQILPAVILGPFAGVLADKLNKKILAIASDTFGGLIFLILFFAGGHGLTIPFIYCATLLLSMSQTIYNISTDAAVPDIVSSRNILKLNSLSKITDSAAAIISPGIGGILFALVDLRFFILCNCLSFLSSAAIEVFIDFSLYSQSNEKGKERINIKADIMEALKFIGNTKWIKSSLINFSVLNFFMSALYSIPVPYILNNIFRLSSNNYGIVQAFIPVGMILGALAVKKVTETINYDRLICISGLLFSGCTFLMGILPAVAPGTSAQITMPYYSFLLLCFGFTISLVDIPFINNFQANVPENIRGRTLSAGISIVKFINPVAYILSGALMGIFPSFVLPLGGSILLMIYPLFKYYSFFKHTAFPKCPCIKK